MAISYICKKIAMTTIIINEKTTDAKRMIEFLKTQRYAKIVDEKTPNTSLLKSMEEARLGKVTRTKNVTDLLEKLKK
jgi:hypothetical protein